MKKKMGNIIQVLFVFIIVCVLLTGVGGQIFIRKSTLSGTQEQAGLSEVSVKKIINGEWQSEYEKYFINSIKIRDVFIPIRNEIMYSVFCTSPNSNIVLGKANNLYEEKYIAVETQIYAPMKDEQIDELFDKLLLIQDELNSQGKELFIYITPSKANIYPEDIPEVYRMIAPNVVEKSNYSKLVACLEESDIPYYDSVPTVWEMKESVEYDVYPTSGTHWSRLTGAMCGVELADAMEEQLEIDLPELSVSYKKAKKVPASDDDIFLTLNLIRGSGTSYYKPICTMEDKTKDETVVFARGGSFMGMSLNDPLIKNGYFSRSYYMENTIFRDSEQPAAIVVNDYDDIDVRGMLMDSDVLLLEVNQNCVDMMSFGFIDYILDNNILE